MSAQTIVYGRIVLRTPYEAARQFIETLKEDDQYPWIRAEMFSTGSTEQPYYFEQPVLAFAASYKELEWDWTSFILKWERILRHISFDTAKIELEAEFTGTYQFFWKARSAGDTADPEDRFIETDEWYFGFGYRGSLGMLNEPLRPEHIFNLNFFTYPVSFDETVRQELQKIFEEAPAGQKIYLDSFIRRQELLYPILIFLSTRGVIEFDFEPGKGYWLKKLQA